MYFQNFDVCLPKKPNNLYMSLHAEGGQAKSVFQLAFLGYVISNNTPLSEWSLWAVILMMGDLHRNMMWGR